MNVLEELLAWSASRPIWQRDALRRLVLQNELTEADLAEITDLCKSTHGLSEPRDHEPLEKRHLPDRSKISAPISLAAIR